MSGCGLANQSSYWGDGGDGMYFEAGISPAGFSQIGWNEGPEMWGSGKKRECGYA